MNKEELVKIVDPNDFNWIRVKRYDDDNSKSFQERLVILQDHHIKETTFLLNKCRELARELLGNISQEEIDNFRVVSSKEKIDATYYDHLCKIIAEHDEKRAFGKSWREIYGDLKQNENG